MKLYIAGSSQELSRARRWHEFARQRKQLIVVSNWVETIQAHGGITNPLDDDARINLALTNLEQVDRCDVFWLLNPQRPTIGAWVELGRALSPTRRIIQRPCHVFVSGGAKQTIFTALTTEVAADADAFECILKLAAERDA